MATTTTMAMVLSKDFSDAMLKLWCGGAWKSSSALDHQPDDSQHEGDGGQAAHTEEDGSPRLLSRQIENGVQEPRAGEDSKDDRRHSGGAAGEDEDQAQEKKWVNAGLSIVMGAQHAC